MADGLEHGQSGWRGRLSPAAKRLAVVATVAGGLVVGGLGIAAAQNDATTSTTAAPPTTAPAPGAPGPGADGADRGPFGGHGRFDRGGELGPMGAVHGEFVTPNGTGFRTLAMQRGQVTKVSSGSITVKSADGFTRTYAVDENTLVNAGRDGIGDVKEGDTVGVMAAVNGDAASAMRISDGTRTDAIRQHWAPA